MRQGLETQELYKLDILRAPLRLFWEQTDTEKDGMLILLVSAETGFSFCSLD